MAVSQTCGVIVSRGATAFQKARARTCATGTNMKAIAQVAKVTLANVPEIQQLAARPRPVVFRAR